MLSGDDGDKMEKMLLIDNYDSFVYNLDQAIRGMGYMVEVFRNDSISIEGIRKRKYRRIVISPGPGDPGKERDFGVCGDVISKLGKSIPIFGVCLGHQGIAAAFGGKIVKARLPMHGKTSKVTHDGKGLFTGIASPMTAMRYHSLIVEESSLPDCLQITAKSLDDGAVMGVRHKSFPIYGVQFHPESIFTEQGLAIIKNFCEA